MAVCQITTVAMVMRLTTVFSICSRALRAVRCRSAESAPIAMLNTQRTACRTCRRHVLTSPTRASSSGARDRDARSRIPKG